MYGYGMGMYVKEWKEVAERGPAWDSTLHPRVGTGPGTRPGLGFGVGWGGAADTHISAIGGLLWVYQYWHGFS